jgi:hypothetical protein
MLIAAAALLLSAAVSHADFTYPSFPPGSAAVAAVLLVGTANVTGDRLRLTPPVQGAAGAAWYDSCYDTRLCSHCVSSRGHAGTCCRSRSRTALRCSSRSARQRTTRRRRARGPGPGWGQRLASHLQADQHARSDGEPLPLRGPRGVRLPAQRGRRARAGASDDGRRGCVGRCRRRTGLRRPSRRRGARAGRLGRRGLRRPGGQPRGGAQPRPGHAEARATQVGGLQRDDASHALSCATRRCDHSTALGSASCGVRLGDGQAHTVRVRYDATLSSDAPAQRAFIASARLAALSYPVMSDKPHGLGSLSVWIDGGAGATLRTQQAADIGPAAAESAAAASASLPPPLLIVPLNLDVLLQQGVACPSVPPPAGADAASCAPGTPPPPPPPPPPPSPPPPAADGMPVAAAPAVCCPAGSAWVGVTASTGAALAAWELLSWALWSDVVGAPPDAVGAP